MNKQELLGSMDEFTRGYLECAIWVGIDDDCNDLDQFSISDFTISSLKQAMTVCTAFQSQNKSALEIYLRYIGPAYAGHDLWLTRNRYGSGFWDRSIKRVDGATVEDIAEFSGATQVLTEKAYAVGECDIFVNRGKLYIE